MDFNYSNFMDDGLLDETDQIKLIAKKTWLSTASTSLANLEKVQTNIYNVGLTDPRDLKATNLRTRRKGQLGSQAVNTDLGTDRSSVQSSTLKAWGSNTSIPDSVHQHGGSTLPKPTRPASAKVNNRIRPPSGRKPRPQSAKEPLPSGTVSEQAFGVKGAKYDPSGRPPKGVPNTSSMGWVGPPAGLKYPDRPPDGVAWQMDLPVEDDYVATDFDVANYRSVSPEAPPPPHASPAPPSPEPEERTKRVFELFIGDPYKISEDMLESSDDEDLLDLPSPRDYTQPPVNHSDYHSHEEVNHFESHTPEKESLRLSLPTADDDYDEADDVDTERLLAEAESVSKKFNLKSIISSNKNIPLSSLETDHTHDSDLTNEHSKKTHVTDNTQSSSEVELSNKKRAEELVSEIITENGLQFEKLDKSDKNGTIEREKSAVKFSEAVTTVNITPRNIGRKVEELHHNKKKTVHHTTDNFVDLIEIKNRVEPVLSTSKAEFTQKEIKSPPRGTTRPPSGKSMSTGSAKLNEKDLRRNISHIGAVKAQNEQSPTCNRTHASPVRPRSASVPLNRAAKSITTVTVDYGEAEKSENEKPKKEIKKRKERKRKNDIETMMERIGLEEFEGQGHTDTAKFEGHTERKDEAVDETVVDIMSAPTVCKSEHEKNYYEISRHSSMSNVATTVEQQERSDQDGTLSRENTVYKTTKTLEFDELEPKEVTVKSLIDPHMVTTKEKERFLATSPDIKHRKPPSRPSSAKPPAAKKTVISDDLERPGSRLGFVAMAPDQAPADTEEIKTKTVNRPASAPTYRRPRSAARDKENKTQTKTRKTEDRQKELAEKEKEEREKVIDNLLERTKCLMDDKEGLSEGGDATTQKPAIEKKKPRPFSAHAGPLARLKETTVKMTANRRPSSAVTSAHKHYASYSRTNSATSAKPKKSATKTRVILTEPCIINTNTSYFEEETEEDLACQKMQEDLAERGVHISAATLQKALYPPSGKSRYYQITADLPQKSSLSLLSHPKVWLPEEHKRLQKAERTLEKANEMMYLQEKAEKRRAYLASLTPEQRKKLKKKKGKKGGKKLRKTHSAL